MLHLDNWLYILPRISPVGETNFYKTIQWFSIYWHMGKQNWNKNCKNVPTKNNNIILFLQWWTFTIGWDVLHRHHRSHWRHRLVRSSQAWSHNSSKTQDSLKIVKACFFGPQIKIFHFIWYQLDLLTLHFKLLWFY